MSDYITPEEARALIYRAEGYADSDYTTIDMLVDTNVNRLGRIAWNMAEMIAGARMEYSVAKREDGKLEFWSGECWEGDSYDAYWHTDPDDAKPEYEGEFLVSRLVIDLEEEE